MNLPEMRPTKEIMQRKRRKGPKMVREDLLLGERRREKGKTA